MYIDIYRCISIHMNIHMNIHMKINLNERGKNGTCVSQSLALTAYL